MCTDRTKNHNVPCCVGIDIGTTTICAYVARLSDGAPLAVFRVTNDADLPSEFSGDKRQDAAAIFGQVKTLTDAVLEQYPKVLSIGFTGQMHGIVCTDSAGNALTPLYTWQDGRASAVCDEIYEKTGYRVSAGYGLATYYTLKRDGAVPAKTACICTVMDYTAAKLCEVPVSKIHASNAASLGLYDLRRNVFDTGALRGLGIFPDLLPQVCDTVRVIGSYRGVPVTLPIGDNQASFLGSVRDPKTTALANFGTGSQISLYADSIAAEPCGGAVEMRPMLGSSYLYSGAALCGGRAYALLERFFRVFTNAAGMEEKEQYSTLNCLAQEGLDSGQILSVKTTFCGTRDNPDAAGEILGIREENFNPQALAYGVLRGMAEELYQMYQGIPHDHITQLAASGNAIRRNPVLRQVLSEVFGMDVLIPCEQEEAALGAAMTATAAAGYADSVQALGSWVRYQS